MTEINKALNLVVPIDRESGYRLYVHVPAMSREAFRNFHGIMSQTFSKLTEAGINIMASTATAALVLRDVAVSQRRWEGPEGVQLGVLQEIHRTATVAIPGDDGLTTYTLHDAKKRDLLDEREVEEVENAAVFFMLVSHIFRKSQLPMMMAGLCTVGGLSTTSSDSTAWLGSLRTSIATETSETPATE